MLGTLKYPIGNVGRWGIAFLGLRTMSDGEA